MHSKKTQQSGVSMLLAFFLLALPQCNTRRDSIEAELMEYTNGIRVINTHEHQRWPEENGDLNYRLFHLLNASYLHADVVSAGGKEFTWPGLDSLSVDQYWEINETALDYCRSTSYYTHLIAGFRKLYDFDDLYFTGENIHDLSAQVEKNYADYRSWFDQAFHRAGFELMIIDQYWKPFNTVLDENYFALAFHINELVMHASERPAPGEEGPEMYRQAKNAGYEIHSLDDYLVFCDHLFKENLAHKAVCVKNSMAYFRTLEFQHVSQKTAEQLFAKPSASLTPAEAKMIQDFMFHWIIQKSVEYDLPVQIHTGYLAGNGNTLDNGKPVKLNNLFLEYPEAKFILFHGGYPWTGEYAALGKMFPNVYLDLVWLPQISREEAVHGLEEMFDAVPYNKFFWGGDCAFIEEATGSLEFGKSVIVEVLTNRIERGLLTEDVARDMLKRIFRENALEVFQLEKKLDREL